MYRRSAKSRTGIFVQFASLLFLCFVLSFILTACGSAQQEEPGPADISAPSTTTTIQPAATPVPTVSKATPALENSTQVSELNYWPTAGWRSSTPEEQGMDSEKLAKLFDYLREQDLDIHSVTIVRNGYIIADSVIYPFDKDSKHNLMSVTKSVISALIGIAIDQGYIDGVNQPVLSFFPDRTVANVDANKEAMTLEHLLMMASGLECRDSWRYRWRGLERMMQSDDWVQYVLDLPMLEAPGTRFEYCNGASLLLSAIIQETSGMTAAEFADLYLFTPLGIDDVVWPANPQGITLGYSELRLQPHDLAKLGYLFLQNGQWDGQQVIPAPWVAASTANQIRATNASSYGYQWWIANDRVYNALGFAGQYIFVVPDSELVAVFTSNLSEDDVSVPANLMDIFGVPAAISTETLPPNPDSLEMLESIIQAAALSPNEPEPVAPLPEVAQRVSGKTYLLEPPDPSGLTSISMIFNEGAEALMKLGYASGETPASGEDSPAPVQVEVPVGLDNVYRFSPAEFGMMMGAKGEWVAENVFLIHMDRIGNIGLHRLQITFEGEQIALEIWDDLMSPAMRADFIGRPVE